MTEVATENEPSNIAQSDWVRGLSEDGVPVVGSAMIRYPDRIRINGCTSDGRPLRCWCKRTEIERVALPEIVDV